MTAEERAAIEVQLALRHPHLQYVLIQQAHDPHVRPACCASYLNSTACHAPTPLLATPLLAPLQAECKRATAELGATIAGILHESLHAAFKGELVSGKLSFAKFSPEGGDRARPAAPT